MQVVDVGHTVNREQCLGQRGRLHAFWGVLAEHRHTIAGAHAWGANGDLRPGDKYLQANPYFHTFGYKAGILPSVLFGTTMVPLAVFSPDAAMRMIDEHNITVFPGAPTVFQTILDNPARSGHDLSSLRLVVTGATVVPVVLFGWTGTFTLAPAAFGTE